MSPSIVMSIAHHPTEKMVDSLTVEIAARSDDVITKLHQLQWHLDGVARARRLLANIPSFMIFDDHEVTDDWNCDVSWARMLHNAKDELDITTSDLVSRSRDPKVVAIG